MSKGSRVFNIMQYENNPITGETFNFNETNIISALSHKTFRDWAYTYHDQDRYDLGDELADRERLSNEYDIRYPNGAYSTTKEEYIEEHLVKRCGKLKPIHWHIVVRCDNAIEIADVARWFNVPANMVEVPDGRGRDAFYDCVRYLTHEAEKEQALGKHLYPDEQIKANFDWRSALAEYVARKVKYGKNLNDRDYVAMEVAYHGMTLKTVRNQYPEVWVKDMIMLKKLRADYIANLPKPANRINYYIYGKGRSGKGLLSRAVARTMFPNMDDDEIFFEVGADNVTFEGYDGQPVIIWNDCRSGDLMKKLGGRENVFNIFDTHPTKQKQNVKYGSINLVNVVNIVNSVQDYVAFLDGLAGEYESHGVQYEAEDKRQSYERFPVIIPIHSEDFELLFNRGYFYGWDDYTQYRVEAKIKASLPKIAKACNNNVELEKRLEARVLEPISRQLIDTVSSSSAVTEDDVETMLFNDMGYGTVLDTGVEQSEEELFLPEIYHAYEHFRHIATGYSYSQNGVRFKDLKLQSQRWEMFRDADGVPDPVRRQDIVEVGLIAFIRQYEEQIGRQSNMDIIGMCNRIIDELKRKENAG